MRTRQKGFTLLEMVVVAVIGILLGIAIPSYQNYVIRSNRTEGQALLSDAAARQERYYSQNPGSATPRRGKLGMSSANSPNNLYNLTIATPTSTTYTLTATPINSQTRDKTCGKLTLNQLGERGAAGKTGNNSTVTTAAETRAPLREGLFIAHGSQSLDPQFLGIEGNALPPLQFLLLRRPHSRSWAITPRTSTSGAEAPAVIPMRRTPSNQPRCMSSAPSIR